MPASIIIRILYNHLIGIGESGDIVGKTFTLTGFHRSKMPTPYH